MSRKCAAALLVVLLASPAQADKITRTAYACAEVEDLKGYMSLPDGEGATAYIRRKIAANVCTLMIEGEPVAVVDRAFWKGFVRIETPEDGMRYWIVDGYVGK